MATDVLNLYKGRGDFERVLSEEDTEQDSDQWCSYQAPGQSFWQIRRLPRSLRLR